MSGAKAAVETKSIQSKPANTRRARVWLIISSILFALWIGAMIAMYVKTVYPQRYPVTRQLPK